MLKIFKYIKNFFKLKQKESIFYKVYYKNDFSDFN